MFLTKCLRYVFTNKLICWIDNTLIVDDGQETDPHASVCVCSFLLLKHQMLPLPLLLQGLGTFQLHSQAALKGLTPHSVCAPG